MGNKLFSNSYEKLMDTPATPLVLRSLPPEENLKKTLNSSSPVKEAGKSSYGFWKKLLFSAGNLLKGGYKILMGLLATAKATLNFRSHKENKEQASKVFEKDKKGARLLKKQASKDLNQALQDLGWAQSEFDEAGVSFYRMGENLFYAVGNGLEALYHTGNAVVSSIYTDGVTNSIYAFPHGIKEVACGFGGEALNDLNQYFFSTTAVVAPSPLTVPNLAANPVVVAFDQQAKNAPKLVTTLVLSDDLGPKKRAAFSL